MSSDTDSKRRNRPSRWDSAQPKSSPASSSSGQTSAQIQGATDSSLSLSLSQASAHVHASGVQHAAAQSHAHTSVVDARRGAGRGSALVVPAWKAREEDQKARENEQKLREELLARKRDKEKSESVEAKHDVRLRESAQVQSGSGQKGRHGTGREVGDEELAAFEDVDADNNEEEEGQDDQFSRGGASTRDAGVNVMAMLEKEGAEQSIRDQTRDAGLDVMALLQKEGAGAAQSSIQDVGLKVRHSADSHVVKRGAADATGLQASKNGETMSEAGKTQTEVKSLYTVVDSNKKNVLDAGKNNGQSVKAQGAGLQTQNRINQGGTAAAVAKVRLFMCTYILLFIWVHIRVLVFIWLFRLRQIYL
jgi:hypothetical protein